MRRHSRSAAMTLIEVVAALALLSTLLVSILQMRNGAGQRILAAHRQLDAGRAADALLANWWALPAGLPLDAAGETGAFRWRTLSLTDPAAAALHTRVVRLELADLATGRRVLSLDLLQSIAPPQSNSLPPGFQP